MTDNRGKLKTVLGYVGVNEKLRKLIQNLYEKNMVKFTLENIITGWPETYPGVRQD